MEENHALVTPAIISDARKGMRTLFEKEAADEVLSRIDKLEPAIQRKWGKMDVAQMMAHCSGALDMASGKLVLPRLFIGRLLGRLVRPIYSNEKQFSQNNPTAPQLAVSDPRDFQKEREQLKVKVREFQQGGEEECTTHPHPFFGPLTPYEWGRGMYKHLDHHLRQFGA